MTVLRIRTHHIKDLHVQVKSRRAFYARAKEVTMLYGVGHVSGAPQISQPCATAPQLQVGQHNFISASLISRSFTVTRSAYSKVRLPPMFEHPVATMQVNRH